MVVAMCQCTRHCKCKPRAFKWEQQIEMAECWKHMEAKLTAARVVDLTRCLSYEHLW